jgi:hypothetical protein
MIHFIESLPSLNGSNGWTTSIFRILLIVVARSGLREQQLLTYHAAQLFFNLVHEKTTDETGYKNVYVIKC